MGESVIYEIREHVGYVTLNRPEKKNAINNAMRREVQDALTDVKFNPDVWLCVLTGRGDVFCSGKDLLEKPLEDGTVMSYDELYLFLRKIYKPIVTALNGPCLAQGGGFALSSDIVIMSERASIGWPQVKRGISSQSGPSFLSHALPWTQAMGYLMRGKFISPEDALKFGIANEVVPHEKLMETAERWAREILENAPLAVHAIKEAACRGHDLPTEDRMYMSRDIANRILLSEDAKEGILAFKEKEKAKLEGAIVDAVSKILISASAWILVLFSWTAADAAENYPSRPVRLIVGAAPGGGTDFVARVIMSELAQALGAAVVIDNRGGAAGTVAGELVAKASPDGQTLLLISGNFSTFPSLYRHLSYDPVKDLDPVSNLAATPLVVVVNPAVPAKSVKELIEYVRGRAGQVNYAAPGVGSMGHLAAELFKRTAQVEMEHVAYKGGGPAITALLGGEVQLYFSTVPAAIVQAKAGRLRAIATTGQKRSRAFPDLPTLAESGLPGYDVTVWFGILAPTGTPKSIIDLLYRKSEGIMRNDTVLDRLLKEGVEPIASSPDQFHAQIERENRKWAEVIRSANVKAN